MFSKLDAEVTSEMETDGSRHVYSRTEATFGGGPVGYYPQGIGGAWKCDGLVISKSILGSELRSRPKAVCRMTVNQKLHTRVDQLNRSSSVRRY